MRLKLRLNSKLGAGTAKNRVKENRIERIRCGREKRREKWGEKGEQRKRAFLFTILTFILLAGTASALKVQPVKYDPFPAEAGKYVTIWIKVENPGDTITRDVKLKIKPSYPFTLVEGEHTIEDIGTLTDEAIFPFRFRVADDALEGTNILKVEYREGKDVEWTEEDLEIEVETKTVDLRIADLDSTPTRLVPDLDDATLEVTIKNIGEKKAEAITTRLILPKGFNASESYSDIASIGTIDSLGSQTATYYIDIDEDLKPGDYTAQIETEYLEEDEYKNTTLPLKIPVKSTPILRVTASRTNPETLSTSERNVQLTITVENKGSKKAERVRVKAREKTEQPFEFEDGKSYDYIGDLDPGETGEAVLKFRIKPKKAVVKTYRLDLELRALEDSNIHTFNQDAEITITREKESTPLPIAIGGILLIGIYLAWRKLNKRKQPKK